MAIIYLAQSHPAIIGIEEEFTSTPTPASPSPDNKKPETLSVRILESVKMAETISSMISRFKPDAEKNQLEKIRQILQESGGPLSVPQIDAKFSEKVWPIKGEHRKQVISFFGRSSG